MGSGGVARVLQPLGTGSEHRPTVQAGQRKIQEMLLMPLRKGRQKARPSVDLSYALVAETPLLGDG